MLNGNEEKPAQATAISPKKEICYKRVYPHQLPLLRSLMVAFWKSIRQPKIASNPEPEMMNIHNDLHDIYHIMYAALDGNTPVGYIYFFITANAYSPSYAFVEQVFILPEYRHKVSILLNLLKHSMLIARDCGIEFIDIEASTPETYKMWKKMGFKDRSIRMRFDGGVDALIAKNRFLQEKDYGKPGESKSEEQAKPTAELLG